ncbi:MAG TPA: OmpA family protein, partial [Saprospiraceae bacterium]|nr:OmpA family protein [Saprospiraceae bacterium]
QGCPVVDKDGDGVPDTEDLCPDVPGMKSAMGCPDMDEDGVPDDKDECPDMPGLKIFKGCPDTDGDGVEDRYDRCPDIPGSKANKGCPEIKKEDRQKLEFAMQAVQFELGKTTLLTSSYPILNDIADIMKRYPDYFLTISGHTDPSGKIETNRKLSTNRAKACYNYLVSKGISTGRMEYVGYGPDKPRFDNSTEEGRIKNRRVEFNLDLK